MRSYAWTVIFVQVLIYVKRDSHSHQLNQYKCCEHLHTFPFVKSLFNWLVDLFSPQHWFIRQTHFYCFSRRIEFAAPILELNIHCNIHLKCSDGCRSWLNHHGLDIRLQITYLNLPRAHEHAHMEKKSECAKVDSAAARGNNDIRLILSRLCCIHSFIKIREYVNTWFNLAGLFVRRYGVMGEMGNSTFDSYRAILIYRIHLFAFDINDAIVWRHPDEFYTNKYGISTLIGWIDGLYCFGTKIKQKGNTNTTEAKQ